MRDHVNNLQQTLDELKKQFDEQIKQEKIARQKQGEQQFEEKKYRMMMEEKDKVQANLKKKIDDMTQDDKVLMQKLDEKIRIEKSHL